MIGDELRRLKSTLQERSAEPIGDSVTRAELLRMDEAYRYDAASSINFLFAELMVIKYAVERGRTIQIQSDSPVRITSEDEFMEWALSRYPSFADPVHNDLYIKPVSIVWSDSI